MYMETKFEISQRQRRRRRKRLLKQIAAVGIIALTVVLLTSFVKDNVERDKIYTVYTVEYGDTLWDIARKEYGDTVDIRRKIYEIERENGIIGGRIYPGMRLKMEG